MDYNAPSGGISAENRRLLELLHRAGGAAFTARDAAALWRMPEGRAGRLLRSLASRGWLARPRRGLYVPVPLEAARSGEWHEDPWLIAATLFPRGYVGGWSACEHWELTDQLFRDLLVYAPERTRGRTVPLDVAAIEVRHIAEAKVFGLRSVWRADRKVAVSDPTRTLVDVLDVPANGDGIRRVADIADAYFGSGHRDDELLIGYAERLGNRAVFKRLGYLVEARGLGAPAIAAACLARISRGVSLLDPAIEPRGPIVTRWNLRVNAGVAP